MQVSPVSNTLPRFARPDLASRDIPREIDLGMLAAVLGMEMSRLVLLVVHPNHDPKEGGDDRHGARVTVIVQAA